MNTPQLDDDPPRVAVAVYFNGPESDQDQGGEEIPVWTVYIGDEEADNIGKVYWFHDFESADFYARQLAASHPKLEFVSEAMPA